MSWRSGGACDKDVSSTRKEFSGEHWKVWRSLLKPTDDTMVILDNKQDLQRLINTVGQHIKLMGLNINIKKTKFMEITSS